MSLKHLRIFLAFLVVLAGGSPGWAAEVEHQWQIALEEIEGSMQHEYARTFAQALQERSKGRITCSIRFYGELGTSDDITRLVQNQDIEFAFQSPGHLGSEIPEVQVFSIHYLFPTKRELVEKVLRHGPHTRRTLQKYYNRHDMELLSVIDEGWQIWTANKPLRRPADFDGLTFRVMSSPFLITAYRLYGAYVITVPYSQIYSELALGRIDAQTQPFFALQEMKFYEVQDYMIKANQLPFIATFVASHDFMTRLPDDMRSIILESVEAANEFIFDLEPKLNQQRKQMIMEAKPSMTFIQLTEEEIAAFKQRAEPLRGKFLEMGGDGAEEVLNAVLADIEWAAGQE
ncbi:TRAP transporter substrate-binding protein DctP [Desulfovermiculus halophilus]|jgi:TRAP-type C4-dicarboxylate transport system substrate-binding protein|uniref:TRAP transporter substrate-binding protein DctP n=1 Tax=Desulfovermiculus halophilus TaxID=339722 RepID=UPI000558E51F|nr:TRAP transporter substrate-binding protein DctP [Desulfovermiculus halophilus]